MTTIIAICFGWFRAVSQRNAARRLLWDTQSRLQTLDRHIKPLLEEPKIHEQSRGRGFVSGMNMDGCDFRGMQLTTGASSFQSTSLVGAKFANAVVSCGGSSFQNVNLNYADLSGAQLTATGSSFQIVTFVGANLTRATLTGGNGAVFQANSFRGADLTEATINCSGISAFSAVDLDSAILVATDLSSIHAGNLKEAFFATPPTFDSRTKLPAGFDPQAAGWNLIDVRP